MTKYAGRHLVLSMGTTIGQVTALGPAGSTRGLIDASVYGDDWMDFVTGQQDGNEVEVGLALDPADAGQDALVAAYDAGVSEDFDMVHAPSSFHVEFPALITKLERGGDRDGLLLMNVTLKILNPGVQDVS